MRAGRYFFEGLDEDGALVFEVVDDVRVVDDVVEDVYRRAVAFEGLFNAFDGALNAGASRAALQG